MKNKRNGGRTKREIKNGYRQKIIKIRKKVETRKWWDAKCRTKKGEGRKQLKKIIKERITKNE